jgi:hypothetical protein
MRQNTIFSLDYFFRFIHLNQRLFAHYNSQIDIIFFTVEDFNSSLPIGVFVFFFAASILSGILFRLTIEVSLFSTILPNILKHYTSVLPPTRNTDINYIQRLRFDVIDPQSIKKTRSDMLCECRL